MRYLFNIMPKKGIAKACDRCCFLSENAPKDTARHGLSFSILSHLCYAWPSSKREERHFVRPTTITDPPFVRLFDLFGTRKETKRERKKKKTKIKKKRSNRRERIESAYVVTNKNFQLRFSVLAGSHFWHTYNFPRSIITPRWTLCPRSVKLDLIYIQTRVSIAFPTSYRDSSRTSTDHR